MQVAHARPGTAMNGPQQKQFARTWHSENDGDKRREVLQTIFNILNRDAKADSYGDRLQVFAKRLEVALYRQAASLEEYGNLDDLKARVSRTARKMCAPQPQPDRAQASVAPGSAQPPDGMRVKEEQPFAHSSAQRGAAMGQASVMMPAPSIPAGPAMRGAYREGRGAAEMMPTPGVEGNPPAWGNNAYATSSSATDGTNFGQAGGPMRHAQVNGNNGNLPEPVPVSGPLPNGNHTASSAPKAQRQEQFRAQILKQQRLLLFLRHCAKCKDPNCTHASSCQTGKELWHHLVRCSDEKCSYPRCVHARELLRHYQKCSKPECSICGPVRKYVEDAKTAQQNGGRQIRGPPPMPGSNGMQPNGMVPSGSMPMMHVGGPPRNGMHGGHGMLVSQPMPHAGSMPMMNGMGHMGGMPMAGMAPTLHASHSHSSMGSMQRQPVMHPHGGLIRQTSNVKRELDSMPSAGGYYGQLIPSAGMVAPDMKPMQALPPPEPKKSMADIKKNLGASLIETFSVEQIDAHLRASCDETSKGPTKGMPPLPAGEEPCPVCRAPHVLRFEPPPLCCATCLARIKRNATYYRHTKPDAVWCQGCYNGSAEDLFVENIPVKKANVIKAKNEQHEDEAWVGCDNPRCGKWVHMICGLFNKGSNSAHTCYLCPWCIRGEKAAGRWNSSEPRPQSMLAAKDLATTHLSDHIQQRLDERVEADWQARKQQATGAAAQLPRVTGLTVRCVNITDKVSEVKPQFRQHFKDQGYPEFFKFKQKVLLMFQEIEGVDVLLFIVYVQEYGADCPAPNRNTCYLSYLDSVKYFRPDAKTALNDGALRTMVYHEVLLAYMEHAKQLGMDAMYIWSCPPLAGDDYVIYCHPAKQKNPKASILREWYHSVLDEGKRRGVVTHRSTLADTFLPGGKDHALREPSTANLPYFDGDFWPGEAENQLQELASGKAPASSKKARGKSNNGKGKRYPTGPVTTDAQLLQRLSDNTLGSNTDAMREDFIVAHFRTRCSTCPSYCDGSKWVLNKKPEELPRSRHFDGICVSEDGAQERPDMPRHFAICGACYEREKATTSPAASRLPKQVSLADLDRVPCEATGGALQDKDEQKVCEIFDSRTSYLSLCQAHNLQFDTLRRAKHSSMMTLFHLHNPDHPAYPAACSICSAEVPHGHGWKCQTCSSPDFEICQTCYNLGKHQNHPHQLLPSAQANASNAFNSAADPTKRKEREAMLLRTMRLLEHASACQDPHCSSKGCYKVKKLHMHARTCQQKVSGSCALCKHMWCLLNLHAKQCTKRECPVPRCQELRELRRRQHARQEDARRGKYLSWRRNGVVPAAKGVKRTAPDASDASGPAAKRHR